MTREVTLVKVDKSNEFVGIKIENDNVKLFIPQVFREEKENIKNDRLLFLKSLALAKTFDKQSVKKGTMQTMMSGLLILIYGSFVIFLKMDIITIEKKYILDLIVEKLIEKNIKTDAYILRWKYHL